MPDACDIATGVSQDGNGIPDECEQQMAGPGCGDSGAAQYQRHVDKLREMGLPVSGPALGAPAVGAPAE